MQTVAKESELAGRYRYSARLQVSIQNMERSFDFGCDDSGRLNWTQQHVGGNCRVNGFPPGHKAGSAAISSDISGTSLTPRSGWGAESRLTSDFEFFGSV